MQAQISEVERFSDGTSWLEEILVFRSISIKFGFINGTLLCFHWVLTLAHSVRLTIVASTAPSNLKLGVAGSNYIWKRFLIGILNASYLRHILLVI